LKKFAKALAFILLSIVIVSTCLYLLGAEKTLLEKLFSLDLKDLVCEGCALSTILIVFFQDLGNDVGNYLDNSFTIKLGSGDEMDSEFRDRLLIFEKNFK
jgi:hypothetical protein